MTIRNTQNESSLNQPTIRNIEWRMDNVEVYIKRKMGIIITKTNTNALHKNKTKLSWKTVYF